MSLEAGAKSISLNDELICVLTFKDDVVLLDAKDLSLKSTQKLKFEGTAIILSGNELWIGDKTGKIHICDHNLAESQLLSRHNKGVTCMTISNDGSKIASGDQYRYIHVWDVASKAEVAALGEHKDKIVNLVFSEDASMLFSATWDLSFGVTTLADKVMTQTRNPHEIKQVSHIVASRDAKTLYTVGLDCAIKMWKN